MNMTGQWIKAVVYVWALMFSMKMFHISPVINCLAFIIQFGAGFFLFTMIGRGLQAQLELKKLSANKHRPI